MESHDLTITTLFFLPTPHAVDSAERCASCERVLEGLERIDHETDSLDITFVKINDHRYAKKYGVNKLPALVYFRRKFPSIYRGESHVRHLMG